MINVDREKAGRLGVSMQNVVDALNDAFGQRQISTIYAQNNQYRVILEAAAQYQRDPAKTQAFFASHPNAARVFQALQSQPAVVSFAQASYRPFHTYCFVNAAGTGRWARYHWEPEAGVAGQPVEELAKQPHDYLYEEFERRLLAGSVAFRLELELAQDGDPVDDPSAMWPDGRERVAVGHLELIRPITEGEIGDPVMMHDPTAVTDGIEISPDDQIIAARRGAYLVSVAERTGGWQHRGKLAAGSPNVPAMVAKE